MEKPGPLKGIRVLDFTHVLSGPFASALLGDLGAEIIKVESPIGDSTRWSGPPFQGGESAYFMCVNRNKRSIALNLKKPGAVQVVRKLIPSCDVMMENFRPGVMERLGLGYEDMLRIKPDLIYASLTAFGRSGPYKDRPGFELIVQAMTGLVDVTTPPGGPPAKIQIQVVDLAAGMFLAFGTLAALYHKLASGEGQRVDTSLLESTLAMMANLAGIYFMSGKVPSGLGSRNPQVVPSQAFKSRDGHFVMVGHWNRFCRALGKPEWISDPQMGSNAYRIEHYDEVVAQIEAITTTKSTDEWLEILAQHEAAASRINTVEEGMEDPGVRACGMIKTIDHPKAGRVNLLDQPWHLSRTGGGLRLPPPAFGQHTSEILKEGGFSEEDIVSLMKQEVIFGV